MASALAFVFRIEAEVDQRVVAFAGFHDDVAAAAAVAAGGAAARNKLLPAEGHAAVATVAGLDANYRFVNKHAVYLIVQAMEGIRRRGEAPRKAGLMSARGPRRPMQLYLILR